MSGFRFWWLWWFGGVLLRTFVDCLPTGIVWGFSKNQAGVCGFWRKITQWSAILKTLLRLQTGNITYHCWCWPRSPEVRSCLSSFSTDKWLSPPPPFHAALWEEVPSTDHTQGVRVMFPSFRVQWLRHLFAVLLHGRLASPFSLTIYCFIRSFIYISMDSWLFII